MEGKAALFKRFAEHRRLADLPGQPGHRRDRRAVEMIAPGFGGINLEDIAAPRCFEIERRLRESLDIPVFHDDQHGTAIVVLAALTNALRVVRQGHRPTSGSWCPAPARPARRSSRCCSPAGASDVVVVGPRGLPVGRRRLAAAGPPAELAARTNPRGVRGDLQAALPRRRRLHRRERAPACSRPEWIETMADDAVVFALANPDPEVDPAEAEKYAAVVASGRSDYPNQINNVLAFPGVFRGLLDARASEITDRDAAARRRGDRARRSRTTSSTRTSSSRASSTPRSRRRSAAAISGKSAD